MSNICSNFPKPNLITYSTIIKGFAKSQKMDDALELYENLKRQEIESKLNELNKKLILLLLVMLVLLSSSICKNGNI